MTSDLKPRKLTFDTNVVAPVNLRAFWGTVCESIGTRLVLTETALSEVIRFDRQSVQWDWERRLNALCRSDRSIGLDAKSIRRASRSVAKEGADRLRQEFLRADGGGSYSYLRASSPSRACSHEAG